MDASVPEQPSRAEPAWLAMPLAVPLRQALAGRALEDTVAAVLEVAEVLAELAQEGIHHRDIKPDNLYWHEDRTAVGDFGLVDFPGKNDVTDDARQVGPAHYVAPEMRDDPVNADPGPADVYSLAKTLWVLASGQRWPPLGQQRLEEASACLRSWVDHPKVNELDRLIERATSADPLSRPAMRDLADELRSWGRADTNGRAAPDLSAFAGRVAVAQEIAAREGVRRRGDIDAAERALQLFVDKMQPVGDALREIGASEGYASTVGSDAPRYLEVPVSGRVHWNTRVHPVGGLPWLWVLFGIALYDDGTAVVYAGEVLGLAVGEVRTLRSDISGRVTIGSARLGQVIEELAARSLASLETAMAAYADALGV